LIITSATDIDKGISTMADWNYNMAVAIRKAQQQQREREEQQIHPPTNSQSASGSQNHSFETPPSSFNASHIQPQDYTHDTSPSFTIASSSQSPGSAKIEVYRLDFGKNRGKTLAECEPQYLQWLVKEKVPDSRPHLRAALDLHNATQAYLASQTLRSSQMSQASPSGQRVPLQPIPSSAENMNRPTAVNVPTMPFGKHKGQRVSELPPTYIKWMGEEIKSGRMHLDDPSLQASVEYFVRKLVKSSRGTKSSSYVPATLNVRVRSRKFRDPFTQEDLWITATDTRKFFAIGQQHISKLTMARDVGATKKRPIYWLKHIWEVKASLESTSAADKALDAFLSKNKAKEAAYLSGLGLTS
jgi:uncharacterized protein (DUF3820 family)